MKDKLGVNHPSIPSIAAVVLAAGASRRMGQPKMVLPWGTSTILRTVIDTLRTAGLAEILVVTGGSNSIVASSLDGEPVQSVVNPDFAEGEMLSSLQTGLAALPDGIEAAMVVLGDQPQIESWVVSNAVALYRLKKPPLIVPSYQMKRGHPWIVRRDLWPRIMALNAPDTLRDFLNQNASQIDYLNVDTPSILLDMDTLDEYHRQKPEE